MSATNENEVVLDPENLRAYAEMFWRQVKWMHTQGVSTRPPPSLCWKVKVFIRSKISIATISASILVAFFGSMIVIGAIYKDDCPAERMIPIYLIVAGCFGAARNLWSLIQHCRKTQEEMKEEQRQIEVTLFGVVLVVYCSLLGCVIDCFRFAWLIMGSVYIYRTKDDFQTTNPDEDDYCHKTLYWFAFWVTTSSFILTGLWCCYVGCWSACVICAYKSVIAESNQEDDY